MHRKLVMFLIMVYSTSSRLTVEDVLYIRRCVNKSKLLHYGPRMARETGKINVWTCLLKQIRLGYVEIISSVSIST